MENRELYLLMNSRFMLECTLATHEYLCSLKKASKKEIDRNEAIVKKGFIGIADLLLKNETGYPFNFGPCPRVAEILVYKRRGDAADVALQRYFNRVRYKIDPK